MQKAETLIAEAESKAGLAEGSVAILALVETARGIMNICEVVDASPRIIGAIFGAEDFALDMEVRRTKKGMEVSYPRAVVAVACRAAGVLAIDSVYTDFRDIDGLISETKTIAQLGYQGKALIHPGQVDPVNQVFVPGADDVKQARRVVQAYEEAVKRGRASVSLDGTMVDAPVAERAKKLIARADAISRKERRQE
jgi:citrate lyase subunit beta/citryl-CoA lyase